MKCKTTFAVCTLFAAIAFSAYAGGFSEEIHTSFKAGPGYEKEGQIFFMLNYHLFKRPQGILRFPDGGQVRTVHEGVYLIGSSSFAGVETFFKLRPLKKTITSNVYISALSEEFFTETDSNFILSERFGMNETNNLVRETGPAVMGLPSPLIYCSKSRKQYIDDIVKLRGDRFYRHEIVRTMVKEASEAREILTRMEKHKQTLKPLKQTEYRLFSEAVRLQLREKGGLE